ncbi:hypothetical protein INT45_012846 [Circinella minor]|uniref:Uncharacterized protein n=1 Tax=Circinella minor TaxID=1195481 RepID=A0A8H7SA58_9FUNG|nr:hypothetical protein INT45_012846 [Circinella minor]
MAPYLLNKTQQAAVSTGIKKSQLTWPGTFEGAIKDVIFTTKDSKAVDFITLLQYVIPTIVIDQLEAAQCPNGAKSALVSLAKVCSLLLSWKITETDIGSITDAIKEWHTYAAENIPKNLQTICLHYHHYVPHVIRLYGPLQDIGARCMERSLELWGPHLTEATTDGFVGQYNLVHYLRNYWARVRKVQASSLPVLKKSIHIGRRLNMNNITYNYKLPLGTEKHGTFMKLKLPVDKNAYGGLASKENKGFSVW